MGLACSGAFADPRMGFVQGVRGPWRTRIARALSPSMIAVSKRLERPQRPRYIPRGGEVIEASVAPWPNLQLPAPGTWNVTVPSGWAIRPSRSCRGVNIVRISSIPSSMKSAEKEGTANPDAWHASMRWTACSCAWRRRQKPALRGGGPKFQHCSSGSSAAIVRRNASVPSRNHVSAPVAGGAGSSTNFPERTISAAQRSIDPRCPKRSLSVQPGQAGTGRARMSSGWRARTLRRSTLLASSVR